MECSGSFEKDMAICQKRLYERGNTSWILKVDKEFFRVKERHSKHREQNMCKKYEGINTFGGM